MLYTIQTIHFLKALGPSISKLILPSVSYTNTQIQLWRSARKIQQLVYFWKENCSRITKLYSHESNTQIQRYKNTNTQIQHLTKCQKYPKCGIFLKTGLFKDIKNDIPMSQTRNYKNTSTKFTNTQIHNMTKCQKDPTCQKWYSYVSKAKIQSWNTKIEHMPKCQKGPKCGIFLKRGLFKDIFWVSHSCTRSSFIVVFGKSGWLDDPELEGSRRNGSYTSLLITGVNICQSPLSLYHILAAVNYQP